MDRDMFRNVEGIHFSMPDQTYFGIEALSASGMKFLRMSPLDYWMRSKMNTAQVDDEEPEERFARTLGKAYHKRIVEGAAEFEALYAPLLNRADYGDDVYDTLQDLQEVLRRYNKQVAKTNRKMLGGCKEEVIRRVLEIEPEAKIWARILNDYWKANAGKTLLPFANIKRIQIAAAMIEKHPMLSKAFSGGAPEVSIFWWCDRFNVPMKARLDYLKPNAVVDLKSFGNPQEKAIDAAIALEIGRRSYYVQAAVYMEAADQVARYVRKGRVFGEAPAALLDKLAADAPKTFLFVFQATGVAPLARGKTLPREGITFQIGQGRVEEMKALYRGCLDKFGTDPWVDDATITALDDTEVPAWSMT